MKRAGLGISGERCGVAKETDRRLASVFMGLHLNLRAVYPLCAARSRRHRPVIRATGVAADDLEHDGSPVHGRGLPKYSTHLPQFG